MKYLNFSPPDNNSGVGGVWNIYFTELQLAWKFMFSTHLNKGKLWEIKTQEQQQQKCFPIPTSGVSFAWNVQGDQFWMFQWLRVHPGCSSTSATARRTRSSWPGDGWRSKMRKIFQGDDQIKSFVCCLSMMIHVFHKYRQIKHRG